MWEWEAIREVLPADGMEGGGTAFLPTGADVMRKCGIVLTVQLVVFLDAPNVPTTPL